MIERRRQSLAGKVRQCLSEIEKDITYGVRHKAILGNLNEEGFSANLGTFRTTLWRARKWWRAQIKQSQHEKASALKKVANSDHDAPRPIGAEVQLEKYFGRGVSIFQKGVNP